MALPCPALPCSALLCPSHTWRFHMWRPGCVTLSNLCLQQVIKQRMGVQALESFTSYSSTGSWLLQGLGGLAFLFIILLETFGSPFARNSAVSTFSRSTTLRQEESPAAIREPAPSQVPVCCTISAAVQKPSASQLPVCSASCFLQNKSKNYMGHCCNTSSCFSRAFTCCLFWVDNGSSVLHEIGFAQRVPFPIRSAAEPTLLSPHCCC